MRLRVTWATLAFVLVTLLVLWLIAGQGELRRSTKPRPRDLDRADEPAAHAPADGPAAGSSEPEGGTSRRGARRLRVRVVAAEGPLEGAEVWIDDEDTVLRLAVTGADGFGELDTDDPDVVWVHASKEGFREVATAMPGGVDKAEIVLVPGVPVRGRVVFARDGKPVAGAEVHAAERASCDELSRVLTADSEGRFTVPGVDPGTPFTIAATFPGFAPAATTGVAATDGDEVRVVLGLGATLSGTVRGADGKAAAGVRIRVVAKDDQFLTRYPDSTIMGRGHLRAAARAETDAEGGFSVAGLGPGEFMVLAHGDHGARAKAAFAVGAAGADVRVDLTLEPTGCIHMRVADPRGTPVPKARLVLTDSEGNMLFWPSVPARTDDRGEALAAALAPGTYEVVVQPERWTAALARVLVERGPPAEVELRVQEGVRLEGTVRDPAGNPVAGVGVDFESAADALNPPQRKGAVTGQDGRFVLDGLLPVPGKLEARDWADRWSSWSAEGVAPGGEPLSIVVHFAATVSGRFEPIPPSRRVGYTVVSDDGMTGRWDLDLDAEGRFSLSGFDEGVPLVFYFDVPGGCPIRCDVAALTPGERRDLGRLAIVTGRQLRGHAVDQHGQPWAFASVGLDYDDYDIYKFALTDVAGRFVFENVDPGAAISITVWNAEDSGQTFDLEDWTATPVQEIVVERR